MDKYTMFMDQKTQYFQISVLPTIMNKHNSNQNPSGLFWYMLAIDSKLHMEIQRTWNCQNNFEKEDEVGGFTVLSVK